MQEIIIFIKPKNLRFQILTIFQLVSAFLASTVQLKFLFFLLAYLQKIPTCKLKIHFVVYRFESHTIHSMWRILSKRETSVCLAHSSSVLSLSFSICFSRPYLLYSLQTLSLDQISHFLRSFSVKILVLWNLTLPKP